MDVRDLSRLGGNGRARAAIDVAQRGERHDRDGRRGRKQHAHRAAGIEHQPGEQRAGREARADHEIERGHEAARRVDLRDGREDERQDERPRELEREDRCAVAAGVPHDRERDERGRQQRVTGREHRAPREPAACARRERRTGDPHHACDREYVAGRLRIEPGFGRGAAGERPHAADREIERQHRADREHDEALRCPRRSVARVLRGCGSRAQRGRKAARQRRRDQRERGECDIQRAQPERSEHMRQHEQADRARDQLADDPQAVHAVAVLARRGARHAEHHQRAAAERGDGAQREQRDEARHPQRGQQVARAEQRDGERGDAARVDPAEPQVRRHGREAERAEFDEEVGADLRRGQPELRRELARDGGCHEQQQRRDGREHDERDERRACEGRRAAVGRECGIR